MDGYAKIIATHPYAVTIGFVMIALLCGSASVMFGSFPDFSDPQLGFETRGTKIAQRLTTWENLHKALRYDGPLVANPIGDSPRKVTNLPKRIPTGGSVQGPKPSGATENQLTPPRIIPLKEKGPFKYWNNNAVAESDIGRISWGPDKNSTHRGATDRLVETLVEEERDSETIKDLPPLLDHGDDFDEDKDSESDHEHAHVGADGYFCDKLSSAYSHLVVTPVDTSSSLFSLDNLLAVCRLQARLMAVTIMSGLCQNVSRGQCCPPWSLPNYVAMLNNRSNCLEITDEDVSLTLANMRECYNNFSRNLALNQPYNLNEPCSEGEALYNMLYYMTDSRFYPGESALHSAMLFLPIARSAVVLPYYRALGPEQLSDTSVTVSAADFGVKGALFDLHLMHGCVLMIGGFVVIVVCLWLYTGSVFLTICSVIAVAMSLIIAHFLYTCVFSVTFFPFMNLLAVVVAIGIGADDAFIYCKMWRCVQRDSRVDSASLVAASLRAAAPSMCVTSITTAAALFANCVSPITAINCFSLFSGTAVLVNLALMLSWLPACVIIDDGWCCPPIIPLHWSPAVNVRVQAAKAYMSQAMSLVNQCLLAAILKLRFMWVLLLGGIAVAGAVVVLYYPKLRLPDSKTFPLFERRHMFELYETTYKNFFWFERDQKGNPWNDEGMPLPLQFVWGILPSDTGNHLDPVSRGELVYDPAFDIASKESQTWLLQFCQQLRQEPFYQPTTGPQLSSCFIELFKSWMTRRCKDVSGEDISPCCESSRFPFSRRVFNRCAALATARLHATPSNLFQPGMAGPKFARGRSDDIKVIVIEFESNYTYSNSYSDMSEFYSSVETWFQQILSTAPLGLRGGWFVSDLGFWDLQVALSEGTDAAIGLSLTVALLVIFASTLNVLLSVLTVITIAAIMFVTVALLVLLGWRLNVLESVAVTTAIGLSVDFSLHYAIHYRQSGQDEREPAVIYTLTRITGPTAMGALTTGAAGAFMLFSSVLPYIQIGILLVVLMVVSWLYSTVFLTSLLAIAGPQRGCGQFLCPSPGAWCREPSVPKPTVPAMWSDTTLSTSSGVAEVHELEALTHGQRRRRPRSQSPALPEEVQHLPS